MNHLISTSLLLFFVLTTSCQDLPKVKTIIKPKSPEHATETDALKEFMKNRCKKLDFRHVLIEKDEQAGTITVTSEIDPQSEWALERYRALFQSNSLELWDTYRINDSEIMSILPTIPQINGFVNFRNFSPGNYQMEILGMCSDETLLESIADSLKTKFSDLPNLKLLWSVEKEELYTGKKGYNLYMINTNGRQEAAVNDSHIKESEAIVNDYDGMPQILFNLNKEGTKLWADMTRKAAHNNNRSIAIVINDKVYSVPRVMDEITAGRCAISGAFSLRQADEIATAIALGRLPFPIEIVEETMIQNGESKEKH